MKPSDMIAQARKLREHAAHLVEQAQLSCDHPALDKRPYNEALASYYSPKHTPYKFSNWCPDCEKRWQE